MTDYAVAVVVVAAAESAAAGVEKYFAARWTLHSMLQMTLTIHSHYCALLKQRIDMKIRQNSRFSLL